MKIINKEKARKDPYVYKNLRREGRLLQRGHHKHVITIYDTLGKFLSRSMTFNCNPTLPWLPKLPTKLKSTHVNQTDNFYDTGSPKPVINREDSDLNLVLFHITYASYDVEIENFGSKWLF